MGPSDQDTVALDEYAGRWILDPERTTVEFHTKAMWVLPTKGTFRARRGDATVTPDGEVGGSLVIDAASVHTKIDRRDAHLRTADFLEVEEFPTITYEATGGRLVGPGTLTLDGALTVHGTTRPVAVSANFRVNGGAVTVWADVSVDRGEWGLTATPFGARLKNRILVRAEFGREGPGARRPA